MFPFFSPSPTRMLSPPLPLTSCYLPAFSHLPLSFHITFPLNLFVCIFFMFTLSKMSTFISPPSRALFTPPFSLGTWVNESYDKHSSVQSRKHRISWQVLYFLLVELQARRQESPSRTVDQRYCREAEDKWKKRGLGVRGERCVKEGSVRMVKEKLFKEKWNTVCESARKRRGSTRDV